MTSINEDFVKNLTEHMEDWFNDDEQCQLARLDKKYYPYTHLFSPIQVNRLYIKNRIVMGPMANFNMAEEFGRPNDKMIQYFIERARGGVGLITSGLIPVGHDGDPTLTEQDGRTYFPRITGSRTVFSGWRELAENIHSYGAHFFIPAHPWDGTGR
jgi:2-enoate reductase